MWRNRGRGRPAHQVVPLPELAVREKSVVGQPLHSGLHRTRALGGDRGPPPGRSPQQARGAGVAHQLNVGIVEAAGKLPHARFLWAHATHPFSASCAGQRHICQICPSMLGLTQQIVQSIVSVWFQNNDCSVHQPHNIH